jgi:hypothetical protein
MNIRGKEVTSRIITVEVHNDELLEAIAYQIKLLYSFDPSETYLKGTYDLYMTDPDHRHGSVDEIKLKKLSIDERKAKVAYDTIRDVMRENDR